MRIGSSMKNPHWHESQTWTDARTTYICRASILCQPAQKRWVGEVSCWSLGVKARLQQCKKRVRRASCQSESLERCKNCHLLSLFHVWEVSCKFQTTIHARAEADALKRKDRNTTMGHSHKFKVAAYPLFLCWDSCYIGTATRYDKTTSIATAQCCRQWRLYFYLWSTQPYWGWQRCGISGVNWWLSSMVPGLQGFEASVTWSGVRGGLKCTVHQETLRRLLAKCWWCLMLGRRQRWHLVSGAVLHCHWKQWREDEPIFLFAETERERERIISVLPMNSKVTGISMFTRMNVDHRWS